MRLAAHASFRRTLIAKGLLAALTAGPVAGAWAQVADSGLQSTVGNDTGAASASGPGAAGPQVSDPGTRRAYSFVPRVTVQQTFTSNVELRAGGRADQVTEISPGF